MANKTEVKPITIKIKPNKDGRAIVTLYGSEIDCTELTEDGVAKFHKFGKDYEVTVASTAKKSTKKKKVAKAQEAPVADEAEAPLES